MQSTVFTRERSDETAYGWADVAMRAGR